MASFTTSRDRDSFSVFAPELTLAFSLEDGGLRALRRSGGLNVLGYGSPRPAIDVQVDDRGWLADRTFIRYLSHEVEERDGAVELVIVIGAGPLMVYDRYRITGTLIARRVSVENAGEDPVQLRGVRLALPWARVGAPETCRFEAPDNSVRPRVPLAVAAAQRHDVLPRHFFAPGLRDGSAIERAPNQGLGVMALYDPAIDESLFCWYYSTIDSAQPWIEGNDEAITLIHEIGVSDWLRSEVGLSVGTQYIMLLREPWPAALGALQRTWPICGWQALDRPAPWVRDAAIFETHPSRFGGFDGLAAALPELHALGLNTLCLLPIWSFANHTGQLWDGNWEASGDLYAIRDFDALDPTLGTTERLRDLVDAAHTLQMRVLLDLPLEGCAEDARLVSEHLDWFCHDERGQLARVPQQPELVAFDWLSADLQAHVLAWALDQARTYGLDGYRVIVPRAEVPNWSRAHIAASGMAVLQLLDRLQREIKWVKGDAVLLGSLAGPVYEASHDFALDELPHHMFVHLALNRITPAELADWLEDRARALPHDSARACFTESHRTRLMNPLADGLRGSRVSRMMLAGMVICGFVPLIWAGQELDDGPFIGRLLRARACYPALRHGRVLHNALPCSSAQVFAVLREHAGERLAGMLNVGPHKQTVIISLPVDRLDLPEGNYELYELIERQIWIENDRRSWRRDELLSLRLTLEPFAAYCFLVRPATIQLPTAVDEPPATAATAAGAMPPAPVSAVVLEDAPVRATNGRRHSRRKRES